MNHLRRASLALTVTIVAVSILAAIAQTPNRRDNDNPQPPPQDFVIGPGGPGGPGPRMMGGPMGQETKLVDRFDKNSNGRLDTPERKAAREFLEQDRAEGGGARQFGPPGGPGGRRGGGCQPKPDQSTRGFLRRSQKPAVPTRD